MWIAVRIGQDNERGPECVQQILDTLHHRMTRRDRVRLVLAKHDHHVPLLVELPFNLQPIVQGGLHAFYPSAEITTLTERPAETDEGLGFLSQSLVLRPDVFPLRRFAEFLNPETGVFVDPLSSILHWLGQTDYEASVALHVRPVTKRRCRRLQRIAETLDRPLFRSHLKIAHYYGLAATSRHWPMRVAARLFAAMVAVRSHSHPGRDLTLSPDQKHQREDDLTAATNKVMDHPLFEVHLEFRVRNGANQKRGDAAAALATMMAAYAPFARRRVSWKKCPMRTRTRFRKTGFALSSEEVATLWHPPAVSVQTAGLDRARFTELEPPALLPDPEHPEVTLLGQVCFRGRTDQFGIHQGDRLRHMHIIGKTGTGKSTLLYNMLLSDIQSGHGAALFDPHGDLSEAVVAAFPKRRTRDVVYLDAGDATNAVAFNLFDCPNRRLEPLIASGVVDVFKKLHVDVSWGPRLEDILRNAVRLCLEKQGMTLISLQRLLSDETYRNDMTRAIRDPAIRAYWHNQFGRWSKSDQVNNVAAVLNKVDPFLSNPLLRHIVGQSKNRVKLRDIMDEGRVLICNLSKGRMGDDASMLLGSLLLTALQIAAMSRGDVPESERKPYFAYVDEFQNFSTRSFATSLSEARKYGLSLTLAHQYLDQLDDHTRPAVFGNVENLLCFRVGNTDAADLAEELANAVRPDDLVAIPKYTAYIRMGVAGAPQHPFTMKTLPPIAGLDGDRTQFIRKTSNHRYARFANQVAKEIEEAYAVL